LQSISFPLQGSTKHSNFNKSPLIVVLSESNLKIEGINAEAKTVFGVVGICELFREFLEKVCNVGFIVVCIWKLEINFWSREQPFESINFK